LPCRIGEVIGSRGIALGEDLNNMTQRRISIISVNFSIFFTSLTRVSVKRIGGMCSKWTGWSQTVPKGAKVDLDGFMIAGALIFCSSCCLLPDFV